jgi:hypothetical protein
MFNVIRAAKSTSQLVWVSGGKGFVYTESQPTGVQSLLARRVYPSCPSLRSDSKEQQAIMKSLNPMTLYTRPQTLNPKP